MSETDTAIHVEPVSPSEHSRRWWILAVVCVAQLMIILDATIVNIALPDAQRSLHFSVADRQWIVTAYALTFGSLLLIGGWLSDLFGRRTSLVVGLAGFGIASAVGGAATSFGMLVGARAAQGAFGALLAPTVLAIVATTFTDEGERGKAFGVFGSVSAAGAAIGLLLGGVLTEYATWRWTLYVNLAFAAVGIVGTLALVKHERSGVHHRADLPGTAAITLGLFGLVYGFSNAAQHGWTDAVTLAALAAGAMLIGAFLLIEGRVANPILPLRVLASRTRGASLLVLFLAGVGFFSEFLFLTFYLQQNLGYSPVKAGLAFLPQTVGTVVAASIGSGYLLKRVSGRVLIPAGMLLAAIGMFLLSRIGVDAQYVTIVLPGIILIGAGIGLAFTVAINLGVDGVEAEDAGVASAAVNAMQQIGGAVGPSLFTTIAASALATYVASHAGHDPARSARDAGILASATVHSYTVAFAIAAAIFLCAALLSALMLHPSRKAAEVAATARALT
jgi:EmrB/QacA subfamily drug resistance transporter